MKNKINKWKVEKIKFNRRKKKNVKNKWRERCVVAEEAFMVHIIDINIGQGWVK